MSSGKIEFLPLILLTVVGLSFGTIWVFRLVTEDKSPSEVQGPRHSQDEIESVQEPERSRAEIEAACRQHVHEAYRKASKAITHRAAEFPDFIDRHKSGVNLFSEDLVSPYGRWRAVKPYFRFTDKDGHKKYVEEKFEKHIFTKQELAAAFKGTIERSVKDIESIENELAVTLEQEIFGQSSVTGWESHCYQGVQKGRGKHGRCIPA